MSREEYIAQAFMVEQQTIEMKPLETEGFILDIGGGGEGIIGKLNGMQVVAIDKRLDELEETDNDALKVVMDATDLKFPDDTFTAATAFYTMMYIPNDDKPKVLAEAYRVLRPGARLHVWDAVIPGESGDKKYFVIPLKVVMPDETVETGYGSSLKEQSAQTLRELAEEVGFKTSKVEAGEHTFYLELEK
jgi:ubiquinone/menaquinone biosynthesis C-methylase UbiE